MRKPSYNPAFVSEVIEMAWTDDISFDSIYQVMGMKEKEVIDIMRSHLKYMTFKIWRKRVSGRKTKHTQLLHLKEKVEQII